jgi:lysophospholipase L1-like esterase
MAVQLRICFVGDSFVQGTGDPECLGWAGRICVAARREGHDLTYYNLGVRRETTVDILSRWEREVACRLPSAADGRIVFSFGANDANLEGGRPRVEPEQSLSNARQMLQTAARAYPVLMVLSPPLADPARNEGVIRLSEQYAELCRELEIPCLEVMAALTARGTWTDEALANDGTHPRANGYSEMADLVGRWSAWRACLGG